MKLTTRDKERLLHVNKTMDDIHESTTLIYENFIDEEYNELRVEIQIAINKLNYLLKCVEEEV